MLLQTLSLLSDYSFQTNDKQVTCQPVPILSMETSSDFILDWRVSRTEKNVETPNIVSFTIT